MNGIAIPWSYYKRNCRTLMSIEPVNYDFLLSYSKMDVCLGFLLFYFWLCPSSSSVIWLYALEAESSEGGWETTPSFSLLPDSETCSGTLGRSRQASVVQVLWSILVEAALSRPVRLVLTFLGGMMITMMQDGYNCYEARLHSLKRRTRTKTGRNLLGCYIYKVGCTLVYRKHI